MTQERGKPWQPADRIVRAIRMAALALCASVVSGCATTALWSGHDRTGGAVVTRQEEQVTAVAHSRSRDRICFHFKSAENDDDHILSAGIDPASLDYMTTNFTTRSSLQPFAVSARIRSFPRGSSEKRHAVGRADMYVSFNIPHEDGIVALGEKEFQIGTTVPPAASPSPRNPIVRLLTGNALSGAAVRELAWLDGTSAMVREAAAVETLSCEQAVEQNISLLFIAGDTARPKYARVPAAVFCKYNCASLQPCLALRSVTATNPGTGTFTAELPGAESGPADKAGTGIASCRGPDWIEIGFAAGNTVLFSEEKGGQAASGLKFAGRIVATPVTVAFDIVTSPIQFVVALASMEELFQFGAPR